VMSPSEMKQRTSLIMPSPLNGSGTFASECD
jgi:hypothetical protein